MRISDWSSDVCSSDLAMLAGLVQAPSRLAPTRNPDLAEKRMKLVLNAMVDTGYMTAAEANAIRTPSIDVRTRNTLPTRSEERREGKEGVSTCRSRWSPYP